LWAGHCLYDLIYLILLRNIIHYSFGFFFFFLQWAEVMGMF
jgi:hypothetical protein